MLVKLVFVDADKVGTTTGTLYAVGSVGNVLGILVATYVLLAFFPLNASMIGMGIVLCLLGVAHLMIPIQDLHTSSKLMLQLLLLTRKQR